MQYRVFIQNLSVERFIASVVEMPNVVAEGKTEAEVITRVKFALANQLAEGKLVTIDVNEKQDPAPLMKYAGIFSKDPTFDDWMDKLAEIGKEANVMDDQE